jgi:branched-chain amino acid transport system substrate-binding protein
MYRPEHNKKKKEEPMRKRWTDLRLTILPAVLGASLLASLPAVAEDCEVKIGAVGPMTAGAAAYGAALKAATEFMAAIANQDGGLQMGARKCMVKVVPFDDQYTAAGGAAASNFLASENIHIALGPIGSPDTTGFRPVAKRTGQISFTASYMTDALNPEFPLGFHAYSAPVTWGPILVKAAKAEFKFKSVVIVGANDQGGTDATKALAKMYSGEGATAGEEYYQRGTTNFAPVVTRIMNAKPDAIDIATLPPGDGRIFIKQLMEAGYTGTIGALGGTGADIVIEAAGGIDKLKGFYWLELTPVDHPGIIKLKADYEKLMHSPAPTNGLFTVYALAAEQALLAISAAQTDQDADKIADALRKLPVVSRYIGKGGWRGKTIYGLNQELAFPVGMGMIVNGKKLPTKLIEIPAE